MIQDQIIGRGSAKSAAHSISVSACVDCTVECLFRGLNRHDVRGGWPRNAKEVCKALQLGIAGRTGRSNACIRAISQTYVCTCVAGRQGISLNTAVQVMAIHTTPFLVQVISALYKSWMGTAYRSLHETPAELNYCLTTSSVPNVYNACILINLIPSMFLAKL